MIYLLKNTIINNSNEAKDIMYDLISVHSYTQNKKKGFRKGFSDIERIIYKWKQLLNLLLI